MGLIANAFSLFCNVLVIIILAEAVMSWFVRPGDRAYSIFLSVRRLTEPILRPFRSLLGRIGFGGMGMDFSPILAIIVIGMIQRLIVSLF